MFFVLHPWSSAPVAYSPLRLKSQIFNIGRMIDYALCIRNFMAMMRKPENLDFEACLACGHNQKSKNPNIRHDGILSIRNFMLMTNKGNSPSKHQIFSKKFT
jgi:hypothetical protein